MKLLFLFSNISIAFSSNTTPYFYDKNLHQTCLRTAYEEHKTLYNPLNCLLIKNKSSGESKKTIFIEFYFFDDLYLVRSLNDGTKYSMELPIHDKCEKMESGLTKFLDKILKQHNGLPLDIYYIFRGAKENRILLNLKDLMSLTRSILTKFQQNNEGVNVEKFKILTKEEIIKEHFGDIKINSLRQLNPKTLGCQIFLLGNNDIIKTKKKLKEEIIKYESNYKTEINEYIKSKYGKGLDEYDNLTVNVYLILKRMHDLTFEEVKSSRWNVLIYLFKFIASKISLSELDLKNGKTVELYNKFFTKNKDLFLGSKLLNNKVLSEDFTPENHLKLLNLICVGNWVIECSRDLLANFFVALLKDKNNYEKILYSSNTNPDMNSSFNGDYMLNEGVKYYPNWLEDYIIYQAHQIDSSFDKEQVMECNNLTEEIREVLAKEKYVESPYFYFRNNQNCYTYGYKSHK